MRASVSLLLDTPWRITRTPGFVLVAVLLLLGATTPLVASQEAPNPAFQVEQMDPDADFRQNVCDRETAFSRGDIDSLGMALRGLELRTAIGLNAFFQLDDQGRIPTDGSGGLVVVLLDEIARRGEFTWRNSFATVSEASLPPGYDWTDMLVWQIDSYDLAVSYWFETIERKRRGANFVESWLDGSLILVAPKEATTVSTTFDAFLWLRPFDASVWYLLLASIVASGLVYWLLEIIDPKSDKSKFRRPAKAVYLSFITFTGHFDDFQPNTTASRLFAVSLAFFALLASSAYTANLASFLVVQGQPQLPLESVEEAVNRQLPLCVFGGTAAEDAVRNAYPLANLVLKSNEEEAFKGVLNGDCVATVASKQVWDLFEGNAEVNGDCNLEWIGRTFRNYGSAFATKSDSGTRCTNLIRDVVNFHLSAMKTDGFLDEAWEKFLRQTATVDCTFQAAKAAQESPEYGQLGFENMSGIFICFYSAMVLAVVWAFAETKWKQWRERRVARQASMTTGRSSSSGAVVGAADDSMTRDTTTGAHDEAASPTEFMLSSSRRVTGVFNNKNGGGGGDDDGASDLESLDGDAFDQVRYLRKEIRRMSKEHHDEIVRATYNISAQLDMVKDQVLAELEYMNRFTAADGATHEDSHHEPVVPAIEDDDNHGVPMNTVVAVEDADETECLEETAAAPLPEISEPTSVPVSATESWEHTDGPVIETEASEPRVSFHQGKR